MHHPCTQLVELLEKDLEQAREIIAEAIDCAASEVVFTSTGTEANNLAV
jgi:cysteine sulfinate desulfinase/cysteine desulfurase-like protein